MLQFILIVQIVMNDGTMKQRGKEYETLDACLEQIGPTLSRLDDQFEYLGFKSVAAECSIRRKQTPT